MKIATLLLLGFVAAALIVNPIAALRCHDDGFIMKSEKECADNIKFCMRWLVKAPTIVDIGSAGCDDSNKCSSAGEYNFLGIYKYSCCDTDMCNGDGEQPKATTTARPHRIRTTGLRRCHYKNPSNTTAKNTEVCPAKTSFCLHVAEAVDGTEITAADCDFKGHCQEPGEKEEIQDGRIFKLSCCNTDFCNGSEGLKMSTFSALFAAFLMLCQW
ncbi:hypothetical protein QR680_011035 [Steinernema hermaphroditum]|uniref:UPAR/Ly6 domain-containing protein n=1 Tax=Steinernema hermaphroditum TaxID=289476 RepID=A0AA39ISA5_9BILA|nr:hypothetical protein QR680_011035 [Steinernema hermaphroditum]